MPYPIPLMHIFCFVNKLLSGDVQISEKNILAQDTGSNFFQKSRNCKDALEYQRITLKVWLR
ncbi:hypothetical protein T02_15636 [Trichinella nativa]|uniref:Uncharacterized protein n=1 Tax=Trichinella nativa TaxID=6335 RepID=A0A0V1KVK6_9BILA|nr:hypothetical protein T02_15636 [Trichinella nativa]